MKKYLSLSLSLAIIISGFLTLAPGVALANKAFKINFTGTGSGSISFSSVSGSPAPSINPCSSTCENQLNNNATGTLTATANPGSVFVGWSGSWDNTGGGSSTCAGTTSPCTFDLGNKAQTLVANFNLAADTTPPPAPILDSTPSNPSNSINFSFSFHDLEAAVTFLCRLDGDPFNICTSPFAGSTIAGSRQFDVKAKDAANNESSVTSYNWVIDTQAPVIEAHANVTAEATSASGAIVIYTAPNANDNVDSVSPANCSPASGNQFALGTTTVTCNKTDTAGNVATSTTFNILVEDTTPPAFSPVSDINIDTDENGNAIVSFSVTANDLVDGTIAGVCDYESGANFSVGTTTVTCTATDANDNQSETNFDVIVGDGTAPTLVLPGNTTIEATSAAGAEFTFETSATDLVDGNIAVICDHESGSVFPLGTTTVNCSASDFADPANTTSGSFDVTVKDTTPPLITLIGDALVNILVNTLYTDQGAIATDLVDGDLTSLINIVGDSIDTSVADTYFITYDVTDSYSNPAIQVVRTVVVGEIPPDITPDQFTFTDQTNVEENDVITSNTITISGINTSVEISITGGEYSINDGPFTSIAGNVNNGDTITVHHTSGPGPDISVDTVLTVGGVSDTFTSTTTALAGGTISGSTATSGSVLGASTETSGQVLGAEKFVFTPTLKQGLPYLRKEDVMELQKYLNANGYGILEVDGKFGKLTKAAVVKYQLDHGLKGDGIVGPLTCAELNK